MQRIFGGLRTSDSKANFQSGGAVANVPHTAFPPRFHLMSPVVVLSSNAVWARENDFAGPVFTLCLDIIIIARPSR